MQQRNSNLKKAQKAAPVDDLFDESASLLDQDDDYALIEHQLEKQRQLES